jgi:hypothetical protein
MAQCEITHGWHQFLKVHLYASNIKRVPQLNYSESACRSIWPHKKDRSHTGITHWIPRYNLDTRFSLVVPGRDHGGRLILQITHQPRSRMGWEHLQRRQEATFEVHHNYHCFSLSYLLQQEISCDHLKGVLLCSVLWPTWGWTEEDHCTPRGWSRLLEALQILTRNCKTWIPLSCQRED